SLSLLSQPSLNSNRVGSSTLKRPEGRAPTNRQLLDAPQNGNNRDVRAITGGRILESPPKARGNGARLCAEHQPQRHGEATRFGIIRRLLASVLAAAGPSDTAALRWWFQDAPKPHSAAIQKLFPPARRQSKPPRRTWDGQG